MPTTKWTEKYYMGINNGQKIWLFPPKWDCGWYWGFGYLGNANCHYHLDGVAKDKNLYDALLEHFKERFIFTANIEANAYSNKLWTFCELVQTAYTLKEAAEVLGRGGSHFTTNPCVDTIKNTEETARLNNEVLPAIFDAIGALLAEVTRQDTAAPANKALTASGL